MGPIHLPHKSHNIPIFKNFAFCFLVFCFDKPNQHLNVVRKGGKHMLNSWFNNVQHKMQEKHKFKLNMQLKKNPCM
jgi:hypothetical protein